MDRGGEAHRVSSSSTPVSPSPLLVSSTLLAAPRRPSASSASSASSFLPSSSPSIARPPADRCQSQSQSDLAAQFSAQSSSSLLPPPISRRTSSSSSSGSGTKCGGGEHLISPPNRRPSKRRSQGVEEEEATSTHQINPVSLTAANYAQALAAHHSPDQRRPSLTDVQAAGYTSFPHHSSSTGDPVPPGVQQHQELLAPSIPLLQSRDGRRGSLQASSLLRPGMTSEAAVANAQSARSAEMAATSSRHSGQSTASSALYSSPAEASAVGDVAYPVWSLPTSPLDDATSNTPPSVSSRSRSPAMSRRSSTASPLATAPLGNTTMSMMGAATAALQLHQLQMQAAATAPVPMAPSSSKAGDSSHLPAGSGSDSKASRLLKQSTRHQSPQIMVTDQSPARALGGSVPTTAHNTDTSAATSRETTHPSSPRSGRSTPSSGPFAKPRPVLETNHLQLQTHISGRRMINQYVMDKQIGFGQHGKVRLARDADTGERVAVKIVEREGKRRLGALTGAWQGQRSTKDNLAALSVAREGSPNPLSAGKSRAVDFAGEATTPPGGEAGGDRPRSHSRVSAPGSPGSPSSASLYAAARYGRWGEGPPSRPTYADIEAQRQKEKEAAKAKKEQMWTTDQKVKREIAILKKCNHENVVKLKEVIDDPQSKKIFMVLEYMAGGEVKWVDSRGFPTLTVSETRSIIRDVVLGLEYLHYQGIIHRDIKPANLLWDEKRTVKISDFGVSHFSYALLVAGGGMPTSDSLVNGKYGGLLDDHELAKTAGSPAFFAPELCQVGDASNPSTSSVRTPGASPELVRREFPWVEEGNRSGHTSPHSPSSTRRSPKPQITKAIDVWALGVTLYCLLFGHTPFNAETEFVLFSVIPKEDYALPRSAGADRMPIGPRKPRWKALPQWEDEEGDVQATSDNCEGPDADEATLPEDALLLRDLLDRLLDKNPATRIKLEEVKKHPWIVKDLEDPNLWLQDTDPAQLPSVVVTHEDVEDALTGFSKIRQRIRNWQQKLFGDHGTRSSVGFARARTKSGSSKMDTPMQSDSTKVPSTPRSGHSSSIFSPQRSPKSSIAPGGSSLTTPGTDSEHHHHRFFKRSNQRSSTSLHSSAHTTFRGDAADFERANRSHSPTRPPSPNPTGAAALLRHIVHHSQNENEQIHSTTPKSSLAKIRGPPTRRPLWRRRSTSRASRSVSTSTARRPSADRSSSDTRFDLLPTTVGTRTIPTPEASNLSPTIAHNSCDGVLKMSSTPASVSATRTSTNDSAWLRARKVEDGRPASANPNHRIGDLWHRLWSRDDEAGGTRSGNQSLRSTRTNTPSSAAHHRPRNQGSDLQPRLSTEREVVQNEDLAQSPREHAAPYTREALRPSRTDVPGQHESAQAGDQYDPQAMVDVNDIDDELEFSDDDAGLDSRPNSFLRNDGRGWMHHLGDAARIASPSEQSHFGAGTADSPTPSVEGGYNLFKPPYGGKTDGPTLPQLEALDPMYPSDLQEGSSISALAASTGGKAASGEAAALRRGYGSFDGSQQDVGSGQRHPQEARGASPNDETALHVPSRQQHLDPGEDSRFADADESSATIVGNVLESQRGVGVLASAAAAAAGGGGASLAGTSSRPSHAATSPPLPPPLSMEGVYGGERSIQSAHPCSLARGQHPTSPTSPRSMTRRPIGRSASSLSPRRHAHPSGTTTLHPEDPHGHHPHRPKPRDEEEEEDHDVQCDPDDGDDGEEGETEGECVSFKAKARKMLSKK